MQFKKLPESKIPEPTAEPHLIASWCSLVGALLGLILTLFVGHWLSNAAILAVLGFIVGALIDRRRK